MSQPSKGSQNPSPSVKPERQPQTCPSCQPTLLPLKPKKNSLSTIITESDARCMIGSFLNKVSLPLCNPCVPEFFKQDAKRVWEHPGSNAPATPLRPTSSIRSQMDAKQELLSNTIFRPRLIFLKNRLFVSSYMCVHVCSCACAAKFRIRGHVRVSSFLLPCGAEIR